METIIVKSLKRAGANNAMLVVGINGNREATMNVKWQEQEIDFIERDVGVGGNFKGELTQKGQYLNVTKVDMTSAVKGAVPVNINPSEMKKEILNTPQEAKGAPNPVRVGLFIKLAVEMMVANPIENMAAEDVETVLCQNIQEIKKLEEFTVKLLG